MSLQARQIWTMLNGLQREIEKEHNISRSSFQWASEVEALIHSHPVLSPINPRKPQTAG